MTGMFRIALIALLFSTPAHACLGPPFERTIFFKTPPQFTDGKPFVAKVTILRVEGNFGFAHVDDVVVGETASSEIKVRIPPRTSCGPRVKAGERGMVAGEFYNEVLMLQDTTDNSEELRAPKGPMLQQSP